jgi:hypothetical protein
MCFLTAIQLHRSFGEIYCLHLLNLNRQAKLSGVRLLESLNIKRAELLCFLSVSLESLNIKRAELLCFLSVYWNP